MSLLPTPQYADRIEKTTQIAFGGLRHHVNCTDGELFDMENLTCADYPVLSTREYRTSLDILQGAGGDLMRLYAAEGAFLALDTNGNIWYSPLESCGSVRAMCYMDGAAYMLDDGDMGPTVWLIDGESSLQEAVPAREAILDSYAEFGDFTDDSPNRKAVTKLQLRIELEEGAALTVKIRYNSQGDWLKVWTLHSGKKRSVYLAVLPRRCDHYRVRLEGKGRWKLYSMARERYIGSELH